MHALAFVHLEPASGNEPTFPIEVYCNVGEHGGIGWLVNPMGIERWKNWPMPFLEDHIITPRDVATYGTSPEKVCRDFEERARGFVFHSMDVPRHAKLLDELYMAGLGRRSPIQVADARSALLEILQRRHDETTAARLLESAFEVARRSHVVCDGAFATRFLETVEAECLAKAGV